MNSPHRLVTENIQFPKTEFHEMDATDGVEAFPSVIIERGFVKARDINFINDHTSNERPVPNVHPLHRKISF